MELKKYADQISGWPTQGKHILAHYDDETITVYQAFNPGIGNQAITGRSLNVDGFDLDRTSWIKPNFLWMMERSGWGTKAGQEVVLGILITRQFFDDILATAVSASFEAGDYPDRNEWREALDSADVIFQWDPSYDPLGKRLRRKAIQLGLRGAALRRYVSCNAIQSILDFSEEISQMRELIRSGQSDSIEIPCETAYPIPDTGVVKRLGLST